MTTSEIDPPASGPEEETERPPVPDGEWHPAGPPTGNWQPYAPPPTGNWQPYAPPPTGNWQPYAPPPTGNWQPYAPPPTGNWQPYAPPPTGNWQPYLPPPVDTPVPVVNGFGPVAPDSGAWVRGRVITHLWSFSGSPGVWAWVHGLGWKRLASSETGHGALISLAVLARTYGSPVAFHEDEAGQIDQLLV
ncbi:MAG TPA: hypothetical protein VJT49_05825 [Amycolatopsis sp.]|uniref:hypothetical protein n=1 Tax=Amycolatopsis sp. TaxID=37632 RepID=UPI002B46C2F0|nr:hypothetical protein [Amycolatopsis sp.]HKS44624.1 hypothetical protein [Amycolatopsis sp.]